MTLIVETNSRLPMAQEYSRTVKRCPVCDNSALHYLFSVGNYRLVECTDCGMLMLNPQPPDEALAEIYVNGYSLDDGTDEGRCHVDFLKRGTAKLYLDLLRKYGSDMSGALLEIGFGGGDFLAEAERAGFTVTGVEHSDLSCERARKKLSPLATLVAGSIESLPDVCDQYDVCVLSDLIDHVRDPFALMTRLNQLLKPGGVVLIATPDTDSWSARWMRFKWAEFRPEHLFYFNSANLESLFFRTEFDSVIVTPVRKILSLDYIAEHFKRFRVPLFSQAILTIQKLVPKCLRRRPFQVSLSGMVVLGRARKPKPEKRKLSLVVPAFNEAKTFKPAMEKLLAKEIDGLDIEIIIVESNSTDGTRELALNYEDHPKVRLVLEDEPKGKGYAVRNGLKYVTGHFVMIQDADLEYDLEDYEALLDPLLSGKRAFVLGARHGGNKWKMRSFTGRFWMTHFYNLGHWLFVGFFDLLFWVRLKDPPTMYKVFRADCLYGLRFDCNRFDFDWELVIKLIRKGYHPIEIPVNYRSRSSDEGKKVSPLRDPLTWVRAFLKYRFVRVDPLGEISKMTRSGRGETYEKTQG